jgi:peroxiredoxin
LRRWEELRPELDALGVRIVTVSTDTPDQLRRGRGKHGLQAVMLSDRSASVIERLGIRNQGFHSGMPGGAKALPIPTTVLVDASGKVRWVDQSENYQRRSDPTRVRAALQEHLAGA